MINQLEQQIQKNIQKIPQKPVSLLLSGGIDSSLVLALLKKQYPNIPVHTFSLARTKNYPDVVFARQIAKLYSTDHHEIILSNKEFQEYTKEYNSVRKHNLKGDINVYILCSIAKKYSNTIVTGDGGDELFGGYWLHEYPLGHKETGKITRFKDIHPASQKHLKEMKRLGFRDFLFKDKSTTQDYEAVWEYFVKVISPNHLEPLMHTAEVLKIDVYTPLYSPNLLDFVKTLPIKQRLNRKIEKTLATKYLPQAIIKRESIGFDLALENQISTT